MAIVTSTEWLRLSRNGKDYLHGDYYYICADFLRQHYQLDYLPHEIQIDVMDEPSEYTVAVTFIYHPLGGFFRFKSVATEPEYIYNVLNKKLLKLYPNIKAGEMITLNIAIYIRGDLYLLPEQSKGKESK